MGITIDIYRIRIGLHNHHRLKSIRSQGLMSSNFSTVDLLLNIFSVLSVAGVCCKYILPILCFLDFILGMFCGHTTADPTRYHTKLAPNQLRCRLPYTECRMIFSCLLLCVIKIIPVLICSIHRDGISSVVFLVHSRLFRKKSVIQFAVNFYSVWLFLMNFLLIILTIPNILNPGPISHLNVLYQNVQGLVNLQAKSNSPCLYASKVLEFQGYLFHEKPDVVILNETWLKDAVIDSEIFPNNCYKVFRRDRSLSSHP